jgi:PIN domain nuclease of toxin-antitoxin system
MRVLLDTHSFLWFAMGSAKLSAKVQTLLEDMGTERLLSAASLWEMAIKVSLGKLILKEPFDVLIPHQLATNGIEVLPIEFSHVAAVVSLPFHHRDPFDRLMIAQAKVEKLQVVGSDQAWDAYGIDRIW